MIDFFLVPEDMMKGKFGPRDRKVIWNMHSDHGVIQMSIPGNVEKKKKKWTQPWGRKISNPRALGEMLEKDVKGNMINKR